MLEKQSESCKLVSLAQNKPQDVGQFRLVGSLLPLLQSYGDTCPHCFCGSQAYEETKKETKKQRKEETKKERKNKRKKEGTKQRMKVERKKEGR